MQQVTMDESLRQFHCNKQVIHKNLVTLVHLLVALNQQVAFPIALDIIEKDHFSPSVCSYVPRRLLLGIPPFACMQ